ncbi:hypothetical protein Ahy_B06g084672 [Arachis hypogaea]|uniref:Replication factor A C-terminal domain-containing protein n=1 Tax=Arachis hypogaea TaxID=3818 RepID=A0A444YSG4_ARAHY|nr:hypothetical protein Ahy_B06g084672 [Arachis hypogaea]
MYATKMFFNLEEANVIQFKNRYRIKFGVIDDSDCVCFVVFDKEAKQVLGKSCVEILDPLLLNLLLEFSNKVADNDESEVLENVITPTKRLSSRSEDSKVQGDTSTCKKIKIENET